VKINQPKSITPKMRWWKLVRALKHGGKQTDINKRRQCKTALL
jgi:hypothetical protein